MITVKCVSNESGYKKIQVSGHAGFDVKGQDLVCAGVSSIVFGTLNALNEMECDVDIQVSKDIIIQIKNPDEKLYVILNMMMIQLRTIQEQYSNYIEIKQEVSS